MKNLFHWNRLAIFALAAWIASTLAANAIDPAALQAALERGDKITVIDVRSTTVFQRDHIPGAINVPATLVPEKRLPRLGRVVVYDDGLGRDNAARTAVLELNKKPGIQAELLEGGFAAWQALNGLSTKAPGLHPEELHLISFDQLKKTKRDEMVLVDLRKPRRQIRQDADGDTPAPPPLTDLGAEFPGAPITKSPFNLPQARQSASGQPLPAPVLVLIDDGDGAAQEMARKLKANGMTRVVVLAGGELTLSRGGRPGLLRTGGGESLENPVIEKQQPK
jgi:rhodanese-related sulfurtransferase